MKTTLIIKIIITLILISMFSVGVYYGYKFFYPPKPQINLTTLEITDLEKLEQELRDCHQTYDEKIKNLADMIEDPKFKDRKQYLEKEVDSLKSLKALQQEKIKDKISDISIEIMLKLLEDHLKTTKDLKKQNAYRNVIQGMNKLKAKSQERDKQLTTLDKTLAENNNTKDEKIKKANNNKIKTYQDDIKGLREKIDIKTAIIRNILNILKYQKKLQDQNTSTAEKAEYQKLIQNYKDELEDFLLIQSLETDQK